MESDVNLVSSIIEESVSQYLVRETDAYIDGLAEHGGWEIGYLPDGTPVTRESLRCLIENWPSEASDKPELPSRDNFSDLDALTDVLDWHNSDRAESITDAEGFELYAVLALMKVRECLNELDWQHETPKDMQADMEIIALSIAGSVAIEAMEAICQAERALSDDQLKKMRITQREEDKAETRAESRKDQARVAAIVKNGPKNEARDFVLAEWASHSMEYGNNKAEFARTYVAIIANRFKDLKGDPLKVTERTITESWLTPTRSAGIGDGLPADR